MATSTTSTPPTLIRALGPFMATALVVGTVIGSGIFKKPQDIAQNVPTFGLVALVWILGGVLALLGALVLSEIGVLFPRSGGNYVFLREGFGRLAGFLYAWVEFWISRAGSIAALATVFAESLYNLLWRASIQVTTEADFWFQRWLTVGVIMGLAVINVLGVRWGGVVQLLVTLVKIASLVGVAVLPFIAPYLAASTDTVPVPRVDNLLPVLPETWSVAVLTGVGSAMLGVLWAYHGWMNVTLVAEEVKDPRRNIPISLLGGTLIVIILYVSANFAYYLIIPGSEIAAVGDTTVATVFSQRLLGPLGAQLASAAVMCSVFGALNGNLLVGPRVLYAASADGLAPRGLAAIHERFRTPARAILVQGGFASLLVLGIAMLTRVTLPVLALGDITINPNLPRGAGGQVKSVFNTLTDYAMFGAIIFETLAVATIFPLRRLYPHVDRPYRCWGYPYVPAFYVLVMALVLINTCVYKQTESMIGGGFILLGAVVYFFIPRPKAHVSTAA